MLRLVGAVCIDQNEEWFVSHHFMDKRPLCEEPPEERVMYTRDHRPSLQVLIVTLLVERWHNIGCGSAKGNSSHHFET